MDVQAATEFVEQIRDAALTVSGVEVVEKHWVRKSGLEFFADIPFEVDQSLTVAQGHRIGRYIYLTTPDSL
jgi:divalent metal cation (Fe/Co/Zn/Cd) transporter